MYPNRLRRLGCYFTLFFLLGSCSLLRVEPGRALNSEDRAAFYKIKMWTLRGRMAMQSSDESWQAGIVWRHDGQQDRLRISGPFGRDRARIVLSHNHIRVTRADGKVEESDDPDLLLHALLGASVPIDALRYWVLGVPYPGSKADASYDALGWLRALRQMGWAVDYLEYQDIESLILPRKLNVSGHHAKLKLVVDEWDIDG